MDTQEKKSDKGNMTWSQTCMFNCDIKVSLVLSLSFLPSLPLSLSLLK